jgi:catechol 2,3-dioxygenase-like lactoylglutathione lyase family enzyme
MSRGIDHIVHAVRDLDAAAELYSRLGFTVGARNRHPPAWGTQNRIVQLAGAFVELLAVADPTHIAPAAPHIFSFGAFNRDFLKRGQGLSMLALEGRGAPDADEFRAAGIGDFETYEFERGARRPDGTPIKVAFSLAFASDPQAPETGFFTCAHRHPENFWNPAFQVHANTAAAIAGVVLVAENPSDHHIFLSAFAGERDLLATSAGLLLKTPRGEIQVMTPPAFRDHFGAEPPDTSRGARLAALRFAVRDIDTASALLRRAGLEPENRMGRIVVGPDSALSATLVFEAIER